jgi:hypothetical protein
MPWIFFLFVGALDFGFYSYALISVQNAARIAALNAGGSIAAAASLPDACFHVRRELAMLPNASSFSVGCAAAPLVVTVTPFQDAENASATRVRVTYQTVQLIPIPGLLTGKPTISRAVETKVFGE